MPSFKPNRSALHLLGAAFHRSKSEDKVKMPGKSNKFDFTNRANSGAKLGEIIGGMLQKGADKVKKDAERQAAKARKRSSDGGNGVDEQASSTHVIDLKAPNKDLGDDGVCAMADGIEIALCSGTAAASLALEDLNLSGNEITTIALARLAPIIELAKYDLKTINLSGNKIKVETDEEAQQWETFLQAFENCRRIRRVDLSDNPQLGSRALEIFARVHANERPVDPSRPGGNTSVESVVSEGGQEDDAKSTYSDQVESETAYDMSTRASMDPMARGVILPRRCGLRSVPYITLHNVGLLDAGALWLSYVLEDHYYPSQLISELNATNAGSIVRAYQQNTHSRGVDWTGNMLLGKDGAQLLERTEIVREHTLHEDFAGVTDVLDVDEDEAIEIGAGLGQRGSADKGPLRAKPGQRRASFRSIRTTDGGEHEATELESARKKIMRAVIPVDKADKANKAKTVELWNSSIAIFWASRVIRWRASHIHGFYTGEPLFETRTTSAQTLPSTTPPAGPADGRKPSLKVDTEMARALEQSLKVTYAATLQSPTSITEVTNNPVPPVRLQKSTHRKGVSSGSTDSATVSTKLDALSVGENGGSLCFIKYQQRRIDAAAAAGKLFRDRSTPTHLPWDITVRLVRGAVGERAWEVCSAEQRRRAIERGQDKSTVMAGKEWLKKDLRGQVLMLLDSMQCSYYGQ